MKESKNVLLKVIVSAVSVGGALLVGENLLSGEALGSIENILAGGTVSISYAILLFVSIFKNYLPAKTAETLQNNVVPVVKELEDKTDLRFNNVEDKLGQVIAILLEDKELREKLLNEVE